MNTKELIAALSQAGRTPKKTIARSVQESGKSPIGCFPIYLPEEIIYASGLLPVGMWGGQTAMTEVDRYIQGFCCSVMRANMELGLRGAYQDLRAIVIPTYCDTMKSILANWTVALKEPQVLSYTVLQNRNSSGSLDFILYQNEKLRADLSALTGRTISDGDIEEAFQVYEAYRSAVRRFVALVQEYPVSLSPTDRHLILKAAWFMDKKEYTKQLNQLMDALIAQPKERLAGPRVVVTGLMMEPTKLLDIFTENRFTIVADDLAHESRQFRTLSRESGGVMERIACRMIDLKGDTFFYEENKSKGNCLIQQVKDKQADGVVVCMFKFCDPEEFDYPVYKKELTDAGVPMLYLEVDQQMDSVEQIRTRIQSFAEMLNT
ncbi:MAG: 2-hydroxyacyl-CoA dehydratase [Flavonifractor sp.]|jgi:benzoyl-CoA reductase/2-hydroxyglutaryl-CoA dehydratase subunit BcrC/BadD/HgdB|nr:2-hydroxyacyl-CoA dehydratase [Flavonifractor sp.]